MTAIKVTVPTGHLTVGVLGGMGPAATLDFMAKVVALTGADADQGHVHMIVDHNPKVPNRQQAIRSGDAEVGRVLAAMAQRLETAGADFLVMACNSAHAFLEPIRRATTIPFVSIVDASVDEVRRILPDARRVGVLVTDGLQEAGVYQRALVADGRTPVMLRERDLGQLMTLIHRIKAGGRSDGIRRTMVTLAESLVAGGAEAVIAGCTEIPLVIRAGDLSVPLIASTDVLARRTVELATGAAPLPKSGGGD
jgi:aspartate racemase